MTSYNTDGQKKFGRKEFCSTWVQRATFISMSSSFLPAVQPCPNLFCMCKKIFQAFRKFTLSHRVTRPKHYQNMTLNGVRDRKSDSLPTVRRLCERVSRSTQVHGTPTASQQIHAPAAQWILMRQTILVHEFQVHANLRQHSNSSMKG